MNVFKAIRHLSRHLAFNLHNLGLFWIDLKPGVVLIELFLLSVPAEALRANISSESAVLLQQRLVDLKFYVKGVPSHPPFFFSEN